MSLQWLYARDFRNLGEVKLALAPGINLIHGENGSGKTSLLEAVYFLGSARSFRTSLPDPLISRGADDCLVRGEVNRHGQTAHLGITRKRGSEREIRINSEACNRTSDLARFLPTLVLGPESVDLLLGPPSIRRRFLNWGLFHVEHGFPEAWLEANRCLRQRNKLLREGRGATNELAPWTVQLAALSEKLHLLRQDYIDDYQHIFGSLVGELGQIPSVKVEYFRGWDRRQELIEIYQKEAESDLKRGFTQKGFQRADVRILVDGQPATQVCSRGELKAIVWSMILAQGVLADRVDSQETLFLIDDMSSEFDREHRRRLGYYLVREGKQVLLTGVEKQALIDCCEGDVRNLFHVKHGQVERQEI